MQKYAIPLIVGVIIAMVLKNVEADWYDRVFGAAHHGGHEEVHDVCNVSYISAADFNGTHADDGGHGRLLRRSEEEAGTIDQFEAGEAYASDDHGADPCHNTTGSGSESGSGYGNASHTEGHAAEEGDHPEEETPIPTFFSLELHGHTINLHFIVNDILMCTVCSMFVDRIVVLDVCRPHCCARGCSWITQVCCGSVTRIRVI
jgi:hypothetical protein